MTIWKSGLPEVRSSPCIAITCDRTPGQRTPRPREQDDAARVVAPQTIPEATKGVPAAPSGYIKECGCLPPRLTSQAYGEAIGNQSLHAQLAHVAERLRRAGWGVWGSFDDFVGAGEHAWEEQHRPTAHASKKSPALLTGLNTPLLGAGRLMERPTFTVSRPIEGRQPSVGTVGDSKRGPSMVQ